MSTLWFARMPNLTAKVLEEQAEVMGLSFYGEMTGLGDVVIDQLEERCRIVLGLPKNWSELEYLKSIEPLLNEWRIARDRTWKFKKASTKDGNEKKGKWVKKEESDNLDLSFME